MITRRNSATPTFKFDMANLENDEGIEEDNKNAAKHLEVLSMNFRGKALSNSMPTPQNDVLSPVIEERKKSADDEDMTKAASLIQEKFRASKLRKRFAAIAEKGW